MGRGLTQHVTIYPSQGRRDGGVFAARTVRFEFAQVPEYCVSCRDGTVTAYRALAEVLVIPTRSTFLVLLKLSPLIVV